jgi:hypothetical protein
MQLILHIKKIWRFAVLHSGSRGVKRRSTDGGRKRSVSEQLEWK